MNRITWLLVLIAVMTFASCKVERLTPVAESTKDISGDWTVISATRNGTDLMSIVDFSQFKVSFKDGKYTLINKLPFLVSNDGAYSFDDPQYPFKISFTPTGKTAVATAFTYPIVNGIRQLTLTFSPGCPGNTYVYTFKKAN
ncbi:DUF5004 domain-containing protein [Mucilaginibacter sp. BJC16-A38]|uniref:DUF5004 domain-containing protein n=1 Tax=Mucilaginibacter phenanthrenivorans TaxID=1234842 RepID=UPI00215823C7|nr:DUF5004 domain-containing protein [Mucilaginibacter phenanthrenivorans]MCR8559564.1 DUF5004 domain-containing protein [Mucilaginibacter phenanthrenivorans]